MSASYRIGSYLLAPFGMNDNVSIATGFNIVEEVFRDMLIFTLDLQEKTETLKCLKFKK